MNIKKNIVLFTIALVISLGTYYMPQTWSAQSHKERLLALTTYNTNPNRMSSVAKFCKNVKRSDIVSTEQIQASKTYKNQLASQFTITGNKFINSALNGGDAVGDIQKDIVPFAFFAGSFVLGYFVMMFSFCPLICCCCCPGCCPSKCCQKNQNQQYTKCQLYWPSITLILALLTIVAGAAIGFSKASAFSDGLTATSCAISITFDDLINGNVTSDGTKFFIGITNLGSELQNLQGNMTAIKTQIDKIKNTAGTPMNSILTNIPTTLTSIEDVPSGTTSTTNVSITYQTSFIETTTTGTIPSAIGSLLGSKTNGGIIGNLYTSIDSIQTDLADIQAKVASFSGSSSGFSGQLSSITANLDKLKESTDSFNGVLSGSLGMLQLPKQMGTMIFQAIYGVAMGIAVLALIGVVLMSFCDMYKCRYLMYFSCFIFFIFGFISFWISIIFSIIVPVLYWGCDWLSFTTGSSANFSANLSPYLGSSTGYLAPCLKGGNGDIITQVAPTAATTIQNLQSTVKNLNNYDVGSKITILDTTLTQITNKINDVHTGVTPDFTDTNMIAVMNKIADSTGSTYANCVNLQTDSWAVASTGYATCKLSGITTYKGATNPTTGATLSGQCQTIAIISDYAGNPGCRGCIDSTNIFNHLLSSPSGTSQWNSILDSRYNTVGAHTDCATFVTDFGNVWKNYYFKKVPKVKQIHTKWGIAKNNLNTLKNHLTTLQTTMTDIKGNLTNLVDSITHNKFGLIAGLNCALIGQNIDLLMNSICASNFNTFYITRISMGIISFGILVSLFCIVCSGVRHFKHSERKEKVSPSFLNSKNAFEDTDTAFKP